AIDGPRTAACASRRAIFVILRLGLFVACLRRRMEPPQGSESLVMWVIKSVSHRALPRPSKDKGHLTGPNSEIGSGHQCPLWANSGHRAAYSITSLARLCTDCGTVMPSALAVLRLTISSNVVVCWTGRFAGLSPLRIFPA